MMNATGIILCGGKSCRFGRDKGMCYLGDKPMIQYSIDTLQKLFKRIIISSNDKEYAKLGYLTIEDQIKEIGPIGGIISAMEISETEDNMIISCDMPLLSDGLIQFIYENRGKSLAATPIFDNFPEPLCSYFNKNALPKIKSFVSSGNYKMLKMLESLDYKKIEIDDSLSFFDPNLFLNINDQEQYDKAIQILNLQ
jgi:molybdopterin-guanine dinucleotide biosynthesis protein A